MLCFSFGSRACCNQDLNVYGIGLEIKSRMVHVVLLPFLNLGEVLWLLLIHRSGVDCSYCRCLIMNSKGNWSVGVGRF